VVVASIDNAGESWFERGTSDKESINVWLANQFSGVLVGN
jgi:hypothetical protein